MQSNSLKCGTKSVQLQMNQPVSPIDTVNPEFFVRILFSRILLKDIFVTFKIRDFGIIYLYQ